ncbi:uncharacterized protein [Oscarella lobularis]|uniref:uncharacterized protein n=1 Tax=Oscarella lobularis TaxID=121494 RepID=UPI0033143606
MYYHLARAIKLQGFCRWAAVDRCLYEARKVFESLDQYRGKSIPHPLKALVCFMHGRWLFYAGEEKFPDAERMLKEACDFFYALNRRGDNDALASALSYNALIFLHNQRFEEARQAIDRAKYSFHVTRLEKSRRGEDPVADPRLGQTLYAQGLLHLAQENWPLAQKDLQEALSCYEMVLPDEHPLIGAAKIAMGEMHLAQKKLGTAAVLLKSGKACLNGQKDIPYYACLIKKAEEILKTLP